MSNKRFCNLSVVTKVEGKEGTTGTKKGQDGTGLETNNSVHGRHTGKEEKGGGNRKSSFA